MKMAGTTHRVSKARLGGSSIEYILILTLVVIPLALLVPMLIGMITTYSHRIIWVLRTPFG